MRALAAVLAAASLAGCSGAPVPPAPPGAAVEGWPVGRFSSPALPAAAAIVPPVLLPAGAGARLLTLRLTLDRGAVELRVEDASGRELARRRVSRLGENLVSVVAPGREGARVGLFNPGQAGQVAVDVGALESRAVTPENAAPTAALLARAFEEETGRLGDPAVDNLVPNADFAEDDEMRSTPRDWSTWVETERYATSHALRAWGAPPAGRPCIATGPIRLEAGRRYRALCRVVVEAGAVRLRALDFDELAVFAEAAPAREGEGSVDLTLEFAAPPDARAARLAIVPTEVGTAVDFELHAMQLEALPERAP